ncbi:type IV pilus modification protein PilV [Tepidimonas charontis]|uniref:Type IV pilus modification protein PilV n=1 Tax=Tepidimonas charontis TaxID=2267262 RepID=A0A554XK98_9BURK|nr:type IV pilus modification protein PilV [Tepidimonas charontis]TSE36256.1 type IV pilus modification protein PilV [Tepidimonas charontis]
MKAPKSITVANRLHRPHQRGAGLVEVLVAIIVFSIGVIGMVRMQAQALKNAESAYLRTQANMLGYYMLDALRIDRIRARDGLYNLNKICTIPPAGSSLIAYQHEQWLQAIKTSLGNHNGTCGEIVVPEKFIFTPPLAAAGQGWRHWSRLAAAGRATGR